MAYQDYYHCNWCDSKVFYDANISWGDCISIGKMVCICKACYTLVDIKIEVKNPKGDYKIDCGTDVVSYQDEEYR